jgi:hypothetical protein
VVAHSRPVVVERDSLLASVVAHSRPVVVERDSHPVEVVEIATDMAMDIEPQYSPFSQYNLSS